jgi:tetratricopeptide (TPR) repeat protein
VSKREILAAAERTKALAQVGARVRVIGLGTTYALLGAGAAILSPIVAFASNRAGASLTVAVTLSVFAPVIGALAVFVMFLKWTSRGAALHNRAYAALTEGRIDEAATGFAEFLRDGRRFDSTAATALQNLGVVCLRRGELADAAHLFRASIAVDRARAFANTGSYAGHAAANLVFALACSGAIDEAAALLEEPLPEGAFAAAVALQTRAAALVAWKRGDAARALELLETHRRLLRNALAGDDAALVEAIESVARRAVGKPSSVVPVDDQARAYVLAAIPESEPLLVAEAA